VTNAVQLVAIVTSVLLLGVVLELVRRRKLTEEYSFIWLTCAIALLILSIWRDNLHLAARVLGVYYPPALLLLMLILFVFVASLYFSVVVSRQRQQIERLMEEIALLDAEVRELRDGAGAVPAAEVIAGAAHDRREPADERYLRR
jgi:hypothetical protein